MIEDRVVENEQKVPLLGDIPLLGALFRYKSVQKTKVNLMVFMRPTILRTKSDSLNLTRNKYNFIRDRQLDLLDEGVGLLSGEEHPTLPPEADYLYIPEPFDEEPSADKKAKDESGITENSQPEAGQ
ncbi:hypothetical protein MNBD_GAMMA20-2313 [hydrothermal vent metagenome]|uniref:Type II/III secretion system secretin-like domain-containing protein n=1 Tax=hydrothermal vent metagenome TaxID=652676 RepID=A0A3B1AQX2_9ZZZZ